MDGEGAWKTKMVLPEERENATTEKNFHVQGAVLWVNCTETQR